MGTTKTASNPDNITKMMHQQQSSIAPENKSDAPNAETPSTSASTSYDVCDTQSARKDRKVRPRTEETPNATVEPKLWTVVVTGYNKMGTTKTASNPDNITKMMHQQQSSIAPENKSDAPNAETPSTSASTSYDVCDTQSARKDRKVRPRTEETPNATVEPKLWTVVVTGFPKFANHNKIHSMLKTKMHKAKIAYVTPDMAVVDCLDEETYNKLTNSNDYQPLVIKKLEKALPHCLDKSNDENTRKHKKQKKKRLVVCLKKNVEISMPPENIKLTGTFEQQKDAIIEAVLSDIDPRIVLKDLQKSFKHFEQKCVVHLQGSMATGLAFRGSDADFFVSAGDGNQSDPSELVQWARYILRLHCNLYRHVISIPKAKVPIVKLIHRRTNMSCDINFSSSLGVRNSELVKFMLNCDPRIYESAVLIKYWAMVHGFAIVRFLTNYAIILMFIFYLQQRDHQFLYSIKYLQRDITRPTIVSHWNVSFKRLRLANLQSRPEQVLDILGGFFEYYADFDFENNAVSPYLGETVKKADLGDLDKAGAEMDLYARNVSEELCEEIKHQKAMCVQDPFDLSHNVTSNVAPVHLERLQQHFIEAYQFYNECKDNNNFDTFIKDILLYHRI